MWAFTIKLSNSFLLHFADLTWKIERAIFVQKFMAKAYTWKVNTNRELIRKKQ